MFPPIPRISGIHHHLFFRQRLICNRPDAQVGNLRSRDDNVYCLRSPFVHLTAYDSIIVVLFQLPGYLHSSTPRTIIKGVHQMKRIAVIGMGAMGSAVAETLFRSGAEVVTTLRGRSPQTRQRALAKGIKDVDLAVLVKADFILSIVPPAEALKVAQEVAEAMSQTTPPAFFVDCNAISPETMSEVANQFGTNIDRVFDGCIIGGPPQAGGSGPRFYISGGGNNIVDALVTYGTDARPLDNAIGAASSLKMCYAGISKGLIGLATTMLLAASEHGADTALMAELQESQADLLAKFSKGIPDMYPKAYRWVAEMKEIADFLGPDNPASNIFVGMEGLFKRMAADQADDGELSKTLSAMLAETRRGGVN